MPRNQLYHVRDGKTYRECDDILYILDGVATNVQKAQLSSWLKSHNTSGDDMPEPWYVESEIVDLLDDQETRNEVIIHNTLPDTTVEKVEEEVKRVCVKPIIYNIKQVPDDRRRTGYTLYRRL